MVKDYAEIIRRDIAHHFELIQADEAITGTKLKINPKRGMGGMEAVLRWLKAAVFRPDEKDNWAVLGLSLEARGTKWI